MQGFGDFQRAVEQSHGRALREHEARAARREVFDERAAGSGPQERDRAERRFLRREAAELAARPRLWTTGALEQVRVLGEGSSGVVHLVRDKRDGRHLALKQMRKDALEQKNRAFAFRERNALVEARSCWCVELHATFHDDQFAYQLMEFLPGGDLLGHLERQRRLGARAAAFCTAELLEALAVVHGCGMVHRDVKPDNVAFSRSGHLKLLDFGLCRRGGHLEASEAERGARGGGAQRNVGGVRRSEEQSRRERLATVCGTLEYMAPEAFDGGSTGPEMDIWSAGIVAFECLVGIVPFTNESKSNDEGYPYMREQMRYHQEILPKRFEKTRQRGWTDDVSEQFLAKVLCPREARISIEGCRREPFFAGLDFERLHLTRSPLEAEAEAAAGAWPLEGAPRPPGGPCALGPCGPGEPLPEVRAPPLCADSLRWAGYEYDREARGLEGGSGADLDALFQSRSSAGSCSRQGSRGGEGSPRPLEAGGRAGPHGLRAERCGEL